MIIKPNQTFMKIKVLTIRSFVILVVSFAFIFELYAADKQKNTDVIIYGGTSAAVTSAVQLARMHKKVVIVCPDKHLGGLSSSGLGFTDIGDKSVIGGISREFYQRVYNHYQQKKSWNWQPIEEYGNKGQDTPAIDPDKKTMWIFEPHVAESIFEDFIRENKIEVIRDKWLDRDKGVKMKDGKIISIQMLSGEIYAGRIFIDATYEGDLMAAAGVSYHVGRESTKTYNEQWNGVQIGILHHWHHFAKMRISPYINPENSLSGILPRISADNPGEKGDEDKRIQAYCFRTCLTKVDENRVPFVRPEGYDSTQYELLVRILNAGWRETFVKFDPIPNYKTDVNNHGPFSFDNIGMNYDYPEATYQRRAEILKEHEIYQKGLLYFFANDLRVPVEIRQEMNKWGFAKDEFKDNQNWPHQIYVREARRMLGKFVMTENEVLGKSKVMNSIGMGSYTMDSHNTQRYITSEGYVQNEGDIGILPKNPYQIEMGTILPKETECRNLIVPVATSTSHIAFGSIRMEPVFMILGQSAGIIAGTAIDNGCVIHDLRYDDVKVSLVKFGQILERK